MSMPSSRLEVATTAGSRPALRSSSTIARCSRDTEPWCALAMITSGSARPAPDCAMISAGGGPSSAATPARSVAISFSRDVSRSASRREFANTIVDRCRLDEVGDAFLDVRPDAQRDDRRRRPAR